MMTLSLEQLNEYCAELSRYISELSQNGFDVDPSWAAGVEAQRLKIMTRPEVAIAMLGGTGAGKTTLVNALGEFRLLPVSSTRACTSAITELAHSHGNSFDASIEFVDREAWQNELGHLTQEMADVRRGGDVDQGIGREARQKLEAVYGVELATQFDVSLDRSLLIEPDEIAGALDQGTLNISSTDEVEFRSTVRRYLDSKDPFWPLVKRVRIKGPFSHLQDGAVLVDLPGLNDPNAAREAATRTHLKDAQFVWIVFSMKRALTADYFDFLQDGELLERLFLDGRTASLTFVGTGSDDIDEDADIESFGLDKDASTLDIVHARIESTKETIRSQLAEIGASYGDHIGLEPTARADLIDRLSGSPVFCVSARDYQGIQGLSRATPKIHAPDETQIPALQAHADSLVRDLGQSAHVTGIAHELDLINKQSTASVNQQLMTIAAQRSAQTSQLEEVSAAAREAINFLRTKNGEAQGKMETNLEHSAELLQERIRSAIVSSRHALDGLPQDLRAYHWNTLRAVARRGGRWTSQDRKIDLPLLVAKPLIDGVSAAWVDFFGTHAGAQVDQMATLLENAAEHFVRDFEVRCTAIDQTDSAFANLSRETGKVATEAVQAQGRRLRRDVQDRLTSDRREFFDFVNERVRVAMKPAFDGAAQETGTGMRDRMIGIIAESAESVSEVTYHEVSGLIREKLDDLLEDLRMEAKKLTTVTEAEAAKLLSAVESATTAGINTEALDSQEALIQSMLAQAPRRLGVGAAV